MAKRKMTPTPADNIAKQIMETYHPQDAQDIQEVVKRIFAPIFEAALKGEMQNHLGYASHARTNSGGNARNGYSEKTLKTILGEIPIHVPRDRQGSFEPQIVKKHQRDVSSIEGKILALYGSGMSQRDIASTVEDIYGFKVSHEQISHITDCILEEVHDRQRRPLKPSIPSYSSIACTSHCARSAASNSLPCTSSWHMIRKAARTCWGFGSTRSRVSTPGCRSSTSSKRAV